MAAYTLPENINPNSRPEWVVHPFAILAVGIFVSNAICLLWFALNSWALGLRSFRRDWRILGCCLVVVVLMQVAGISMVRAFSEQNIENFVGEILYSLSVLVFLVGALWVLDRQQIAAKFHLEYKRGKNAVWFSVGSCVGMVVLAFLLRSYFFDEPTVLRRILIG